MFYGESHPYRASLSDVRVIMVTVCVLVVELLCRPATGQIPALNCLLPSMHGHMWLCLVLSDIK
jgi:hypothetical protein